MSEVITMSYSEAISKITKLESYADEFVRAGNDTGYQNTQMNQVIGELVCRYIRCARYNSFEWRFLAGEKLQTFEDFVSTQDATLADLKYLETLTLPNNSKDTLDFVHMFATVNMIYRNHAVTGGWGGDCYQLADNVVNDNYDWASLIATLKSLFLKEGSGFDAKDFYSDLDASNVYHLSVNQEQTLSYVLNSYWTSKLTNYDRVKMFLENEVSVTEEIERNVLRTTLYNKFNTNENLLRHKGSLYEEQIDKAAVCVFADYLHEVAYPVKATSIQLDKTSMALTIAGFYRLVPSILPENTANKSVKWSSSNTKVATVNSAGTVIAKGTGSATITATTADGSNRTATCRVTVRDYQNGDLVLSDLSLTLSVGDTHDLRVSRYGMDSAAVMGESEFNWASDNSNIVSVDRTYNSGTYDIAKITAVKVGVTSIKAISKTDSSKKVVCIVSVK